MESSSHPDFQIGENDDLKEESEYCCEIRVHRRGKKRGRKPKKAPVFREGHWSEEEHELYLQFLKNSDELPEQIRRKIFKYMSQFIKTRSATQCRSHHQKFNNIIQQRNNDFEDCSGFIDLESKKIWGGFWEE